MGLLKNRAYFKRSESKTETVEARKKGANVNARDVEQFSDADIVFSGYLIKQGSFWKSWRKRYFILRRDVPVLAYYTSQDNLVKLGEIVIDAETRLDACKAPEHDAKENSAINAPTKQGATDNKPGLPDAKRAAIDPLANRFINEKGMIEDVFDGIEWLNSAVSFEIVESKDATSKMQYAKCTQVVSSDSGDSVVATFAVPKEVFSKLPLALQRDHALKVHAIFFTQGINEMQSVANSVFDTSLQDEINLASARRLQRWFQMYKGCVSSMKSLGADRQAELLSLETELAILVENVKQSKRSSVQKKNVNILIESSDLCRRLGASRTTCCKSGKDRTSMSVTLECSRLLVDKFHVKQGVHLCNAMRERGVRRVNVLANTGKNKYAFNSLQLKYLPDCYRPPLLTADSSVAS
ncbi:hypothetical protein ATCC90586_002251 [Pythium insidiosum]|nr:hypothetical protein ATCC90586_002251 [Pythium insidiosum]